MSTGRGDRAGQPAEVVVADDDAQARQRAAATFAEAAERALERHGRFDVVLAGGRTPAGMYDLLRSAPLVGRVAWRKVHVWFGDERCVPPDHPDSNYGMARAHLLDGVPTPRDQVHRFLGERDPDEAAAAYARELAGAFGRGGEAPVRCGFDLVLLGMGGEGHTASLFPGSDAIASTALTAAPMVEKLGARRLTLTPRSINDAQLVVFLVTGGGKAWAVREALRGNADPGSLPARAIRPHDGRVMWILDQESAAGLDGA